MCSDRPNEPAARNGVVNRPSSAEWDAILDAFDRLSGLSGSVREGKIAAMALPPPIEGRVRSMLSGSEQAGVLDTAAPLTLMVPSPDYASLASGAVIGSFRVEQLIGRGGSGEVYLAYRTRGNFDQRVALKMLRPEAASRFDRFDEERRMLGGLEHPGIARLIDGGIAPDGRPYMALEYVEGSEITAWCTVHRADLATRLQLFLQLCEAVRYAHAHLIVHRDLKPGNILVDRDGRARLLDFGIALLIDPAAFDRTATQALATPCYAAPEQLNGGKLSVATDIYSLGALLYELLAGQDPWRFGETDLWQTMLRRMLHEEPPVASSTAQDPNVTPAQIAGDLDAIIAKAMRRSPADRYTSVDALADDIRRHQALQPVRARSGSRSYRVRRLIRRNRWTLSAAAIVTLALAAGGAGTAWQAQRAAEERDVARSEAARLESVNQAMMLVFRDASDPKQIQKSASDSINSTANRLAQSLPPESPESASIIAALADLYLMVENREGARSLIEAAMARGIGRGDPLGESRLRLKLATVLVAERRFDEARALLAAVDSFWRTDPRRFRREHVEAVGARAFMLRLEGKREEGIALLMDNMAEAERAYAGYDRDLATRYANLFTHLTEAGRYDEALAILRRGETLLAGNGQQYSNGALNLMRLEAGLATRRGDFTGAATLLAKVVAERRIRAGRSTALAVDLLRYAKVLNLQGHPREALGLLDEALPVSAEHIGPDTPATSLIQLARADALTDLGRVDEAERVLATVSARLAGQKPVETTHAVALMVHARVALARGDLAGGRAALQAAKAAFAQIGPAASLYAPDIKAMEDRIARGAP